jgi:hypothetical protein
LTSPDALCFIASLNVRRLQRAKINFIAHKEVLMFQNKTHLAGVKFSISFLTLGTLLCIFAFFFASEMM